MKARGAQGPAAASQAPSFSTVRISLTPVKRTVTTAATMNINRRTALIRAALRNLPVCMSGPLPQLAAWLPGQTDSSAWETRRLGKWLLAEDAAQQAFLLGLRLRQVQMPADDRLQFSFGD